MTKPQILAALNHLIDDHWDSVYSRPAVEIDAQTRGVLADALGALFLAESAIRADERDKAAKVADLEWFAGNRHRYASELGPAIVHAIRNRP